MVLEICFLSFRATGPLLKSISFPKAIFTFVCVCVCLYQILTLEERADSSGETQEERQGKMLLHTEYSLLSLLHNQDGVVHHHGLFQV